MKKNLFVLFSLLTVIVTACAPVAPVPTQISATQPAPTTAPATETPATEVPAATEATTATAPATVTIASTASPLDYFINNIELDHVAYTSDHIVLYVSKRAYESLGGFYIYVSTNNFVQGLANNCQTNDGTDLPVNGYTTLKMDLNKVIDGVYNFNVTCKWSNNPEETVEASVKVGF